MPWWKVQVRGRTGRAGWTGRDDTDSPQDQPLNGDRIDGFHLHDNDGITDQHLPFGENAWFLNIIDEFKDKAQFIIENFDQYSSKK